LDQTTILIIDPTETNDLKQRLSKYPELRVLGDFNNVDIGFTQAERYQPNIIILNVDLLGIDILSIAETFAMEFPLTSLILLTSSKSRRVFRYALQSGAKDVLTLPIEGEQLYNMIKRVVGQEQRRQQLITVQKKERPQFKTITVFSTKGGVGKSTVALNLALAIRKNTKKRVALVDLDLMSGNIALMSGVTWKRSIKDLVDEMNNLDEETLDNYLVKHPSGVRILSAPIQAEYANFIQAEHVEKVLAQLSKSFNYVIIDAPAHFHDTVIPALERAEDILLLTTLDLASIQNLKQCMELLIGLSMHSKARLIINRMGYAGGLKVSDLEEELGMHVHSIIPDAEKAAINAVNTGEPIVLSAKNSIVAKEFDSLASRLMTDDDSSKAGLGGWGIRFRR